MNNMNWGAIEDIYLALTRIFDGFLKFLYEIFGSEEE